MNNRTITIIIIISILIFMATVPQSWFQDISIPCYHQKITGVRCPLCGLTSATYNLVHFNFKRALELNFVVLPLSLLILSEITYVFKKEKLINKLSKILLISTIAGLVIIYAIRISLVLSS